MSVPKDLWHTGILCSPTRALATDGMLLHASIEKKRGYPSNMDQQSLAITGLLARVAQGDKSAADELAIAVRQRLEQIANRELAAVNHGDLHGLTLEPSVFANDALLKLLAEPGAFENRQHFFAYATRMMTHAMIDYQRRRNAQKRGGDQQKVSLACIGETEAFDFIDVAKTLDALEAIDPRKADLARMRIFLGATMEEAADALDISLSSAERDWRFLRRWLATRLDQEGWNQENSS